MTTAEPNTHAQPHAQTHAPAAQGGPSHPVPVIIDCDTGIDDALALLFAVRHPGIDLRAVSCVAGNTDVDQVVRNTLTVLDQAGAPDLPVARGAERPLIEPARPPPMCTDGTAWATSAWPRPAPASPSTWTR